MNVRLTLGFSVVAIALLLPSSGATQTMTASPQFTAEQHRDAVFAGLFAAGNRWPFKHWDNGYLIAWDHESSPSVPSVVLFDSDGRLVREVVVWFPEAVRVNVSDAVITKSGRLLVSGAAANGKGAIADFIAGFDSSGKMTQTIRTSPFVAINMCAPDDNSIWAYGWDRAAEGTGRYSMLREYSFEKGLQNALLDRSTMPTDYLIRGQVPGSVGLRCSASKLALYVAQTGELIEHDVASPKSLVRNRMPKLSDSVQVTGYTLTESGDFLASMKDTSKSPPAHGLFGLRRAGEQPSGWVPVLDTLSQQSTETPEAKIVGSDGDDVVYLSVGTEDS
jgi:hypothetical protein